MIDLKLEPILKYLREQKYDANLQTETQQIYLIFKILQKDFPVFIRVFDSQDLLQLLVFMPCAFREKVAGDCARLLHLLNKELDLPGFGMDESSGALFYRLSIPFFGKTFDEKLLDGFLGSMKQLSETLYPAIEAVASGAATFEDILKKAEAK